MMPILVNQAKKRIAAGALFLDEAERVLLVNPTYKPQWEIPGGMVEENEAPGDACRREIEEELGLSITPGHLLSIGHLPAKDARGDSLRLIFWGGVLDEMARARLRLPVDELSEYRFVTLTEAALLVTPSLHAQLGQCLENLQINRQIYMETR
jgi:8-oxo-dGTP diphosphatase